jgi:exopolysaccharide biosynthesis WecB/TagA/CpsF family protein
MARVKILNIGIDNFSMSDFLAKLDNGVVFTPNVDHLMKLQSDPDFFKIYSCADYVVCDSKILIYAAKLLGTPLKEKISGSDLFPAFCRYHKSNDAVKIFLLGGKEGVARKAQGRINSHTGRDIIVGSYAPPFGFEHDPRECAKILELINQSGATVLAVGLGAPKQERFIAQYRHQLPQIKIFFAIGATIDFEAGNVCRAPQWVSEVGLEWLYRLVSEPNRLWKRYLVEDPPFLWLVLKQKLGLYVDPFTTAYQSEVESAT